MGIGDSINRRNSSILDMTIAFARLAAGQDCGNDPNIVGGKIVFDSNGNILSVNGNQPSAEDLPEINKLVEQYMASNHISGPLEMANKTIELKGVCGILLSSDDTLLAGGMIALQAKIDMMIASITMSISIRGKLSELLKQAARA